MGRGPKPAKGKAKPAVSRKSPRNEGATIRDLEKRLAATAEILRLISSSPADAQPVFDAIADSAMRLFAAWSALVFRYDGELLSLAAARGGLPGSSESFLARFQAPRRPDDDMLHGRTVITRAVQHVVDVEADAYRNHHVRRSASERGFRSVVWVPMLRGNEAVGAIGVSRVQPGGFSDAEIAQLQTFADQAVIAIENVRLFTETKEALERQTATAEILRVISSSPTDVQPVFETIARNAGRLCDAVLPAVFRLEGGLVHVVAAPGSPESREWLQRAFPRPIGSGATSRAMSERRIIEVPDTEAIGVAPFTREAGRIVGFRSQLVAPMLRDGTPIGAISVLRREPGPFSEAHTRLLQTFADQAVIAIENVRLFKELEARNRELTTALDTQTATSDILRVIASSQMDVQPVFDAIVAARPDCATPAQARWSASMAS